MPQLTNREPSYYALGPGIIGTRQTLALMAEVARAGARNPTVREHAESIVNFLPGRAHALEVAAVLDWVQSNVRYLAGPPDIEQVHAPDVLLETRQGKCTDSSVLVASLLRSIGYPVKFIATAYTTPGAFEHVYVAALVEGVWVPLDATIPTDANCDTLPCPGTYGYEPPGALSRLEQPV